MISTYLKSEIGKARKWGYTWSHIHDIVNHYRQVIALGLDDIDPVYHKETVLHLGVKDALIAYITEHFEHESAVLASMGWDNISIAVKLAEVFSSDDLWHEIECWEVEEAQGYHEGSHTGLPHWQVVHNGRAYAVKAEMFSHRITETSKSARAAQMKSWGTIYTNQYIALLSGDVFYLSWHLEIKYKRCVLARGYYSTSPQPDVYYMQPFIGEAWQLDPYEFLYKALESLHFSWEDNITKYLHENDISGVQIFMETPEVYWPHIGEE